MAEEVKDPSQQTSEAEESMKMLPKLLRPMQLPMLQLKRKPQLPKQIKQLSFSRR